MSLKEARENVLALLLGLVALLLVLNLGTGERVQRVEAQQFATNYIWVDSLITTTATQDSIFDTEWQQVVIKSDTVDLWIKAGAPDTSNFSSRDWYKLDSGESIAFGPSTKLKRLMWKSDAGTGNIFFIGYKRVAQY